MSWRDLKQYWIMPNDLHGPPGIGVTAFSLEDACSIVERLGYRLPGDPSLLDVVVGVRVDALDAHVRKNMGPTAVRGVWYPFWIVGVPRE